MKTVLAVLALGLAAPASSQQLLAWQMGARSPFLSSLLPGVPRPLPPGVVRPGPRPVPGPTPALPPEAAPIALSGYQVEGTVNDALAELSYRIAFRNPTDRRLEGVLLIPIPADTVLSGFSMTVAGVDTKGELLDAKQAAGIYESIVRRAADPGLLELVGERLVRARVFPIEPRGEIVVRFKMSQTVAQSGGLFSLRVPMSSARFTAAERGRATARIALKGSRPLRAVLTPGSSARVERRGADEAVISYEEGADGPRDLALSYSLASDPLAAGLLSFREPGEDGTFMLTLSPRVEDESKPAPKKLVLVVDRSGSMAGEKMEQAKKAMRYVVSRLSAQDRFGIVDFATDWNALGESLIAADEAGKARALRYIDRLEPAGGTNISAGVSEGLRLLGTPDERVPMLFFLTDGLPTAGETRVEELLRQAAQANAAARARVFSFGVGTDVNTLLLDKLSEGGRGARDYVLPEEDIEAKVSTLYQKVSRPALTDVRLRWEGVETLDVHPRQAPDLFHGSELTVYGRYSSSGKGRLIVTGRAGGKELRFEYPVELPESDARNPGLPRLWASRKVAVELDAIRLSGREPDPEQVGSIVKLAKKYGIVTPYTSFLVTEEGENLQAAQDQMRRSFANMVAQARGSGFSRSVSATRGAMADSAALGALSGGGSAGVSATAAFVKANAMESGVRERLRAENRRVSETRTVGDKTFYRRGEAWVDGESEGSRARTRAVKARSAEYFELIRREPFLARCFALGDELSVLWRGTVYKVSAKR